MKRHHPIIQSIIKLLWQKEPTLYTGIMLTTDKNSSLSVYLKGETAILSIEHEKPYDLTISRIFQSSTKNATININDPELIPKTIAFILEQYIPI